MTLGWRSVSKSKYFVNAIQIRSKVTSTSLSVLLFLKIEMFFLNKPFTHFWLGSNILPFSCFYTSYLTLMQTKVSTFVQSPLRVMVMVYNAIFNNISAILWRSVLLVEETGVPGENHQPVASHWQTLIHKMLYRVHLAWARFELTTVVIASDCIGSYKSNYHTITTTTGPQSPFKITYIFPILCTKFKCCYNVWIFY
jgi:hypothetical protein